jgi:DNA-binding NarL/FixJ family response regulator
MGENIRILLVDDHFAARASLAIILRHENNMEVIGEASDGQMAVELTQELHPDVIIMDVSMPVLNGIEATRLITSDHPDAKVIGFTMNFESNLVDAMQKAGATACLSKSDPIDDLLKTIRNCYPA